MSKKKNFKGLEENDLLIINEKMNGQFQDEKMQVQYNNYEKALDYKINLKCKNQTQKELHNLIKEKDIIFAIGSPGSGKSFVSLADALYLLKSDNLYKKIIIMVPTCESSSYLSIGFLPGTYEDKIAPYLEADSYTMEKILSLSGNQCPKDIVKTLIKLGLIEFQLVNFARGKSFDNAILLISEAENYSKDEMLLLLTRIGDNVKVIVSGDQNQLDRKDIKKSKERCGLMYAVEKMKYMDEVGVVEFTDSDIVRNKLITKIIECWNK